MSLVILFTPLIAQENAYFNTQLYTPKPVIEVSDQVETPKDTILCSCINYLKTLGVKIRGYAGDIQSNSTPKVGGVVLLSYNEQHAAYIKELETDGMTVLESNFIPCQKSSRFIYYNDSHIRGYYDDTF